jgi:hypothetical protein
LGRLPTEIFDLAQQVSTMLGLEKSLIFQVQAPSKNVTKRFTARARRVSARV